MSTAVPPVSHLVGVLSFFHISRRGGYGLVFVPALGEFFFLHSEFVKSGTPVPGATVRFTPLPAPPEKPHRQAGDAIIEAAVTPETRLTNFAIPRDVKAGAR